MIVEIAVAELTVCVVLFFFFSSRRRHTRWTGDWSLDVCSSDLLVPVGVAVDAQRNLYVADALNNRIQKLSPRGEVLTSWGSWGLGPGQYEHPLGVAVDGRGHV